MCPKYFISIGINKSYTGVSLFSGSTCSSILRSVVFTFAVAINLLITFAPEQFDFVYIYHSNMMKHWAEATVE